MLHSLLLPKLWPPIWPTRLHSVKACALACLLPALLLVTLPPAHAQYGPPPNAGHWNDPTTIFNGYNSATSTQQGTTTTITHQPYTTPYPVQANGASSDNRFPSHVEVEGTFTITRVWSGPGPAPTKPVYILETSSAGGQGGVYGSVFGAGTAQDALDDPPVAIPGGVGSSGSKLIQVDASSGVISLSGTISASGDTPILLDWPSQGFSFVGSSFYWDFDNRAVTISSNIDPTYHKDPVTSQPVQNQPALDGTINADSVQLGDLPGAAITYFGNPVGSWAADSSYHWYSAATGHSAAGTFTVPSDLPYGFDVPYGNSVNFANQEHINLHCIDTGDGASATANYYVNWHNDFDDWITVVDTKDYGLLTRVTAVYHPLDDAKYSADFENSVKVDVKATGEGNLGTDKIGAKFGAEIGAEYETSTKVTTEYTWVANKYNWIERQSFWHHREGTVDTYDFHGYTGLLHWTLDSAYNPGNPLVIDFLESQRAEDAGPAY